MSETTVGRKDDAGKLRWGLLRKSLVVCLESVIRVLMFGANKYGNENWQLVENPKVRYRDALDRHLAEIDKGVMVDPDTGEHHMAHVATNALFLLWFYLTEVKETSEPAPDLGWRKNTGESWDAPAPLIGRKGLVQVRLRSGRGFETSVPTLLDWRHCHGAGDIMEYRLLPDTGEYDPHGEGGR